MFLRIPLLAACRQWTLHEADLCVIGHDLTQVGSPSPAPLPWPSLGGSPPTSLHLCPIALPTAAPVMGALIWLSLHRKGTKSHFTEGFSGERPGRAAAQEALRGPFGRKIVPVLRCLKRMCMWVWGPLCCPSQICALDSSCVWKVSTPRLVALSEASAPIWGAISVPASCKDCFQSGLLGAIKHSASEPPCSG